MKKEELMKSDCYVIMQNMNDAPQIITDHQGVPRNLEPRGRKGDTVKIMIEDKPESVNMATRKYMALRAADLRVLFAPGMKIGVKESKTAISQPISNPDMAEKMKFLHDEAALNAKGNNVAEARKRRLVAEKALGASVEQPVQREPVAPRPTPMLEIEGEDGPEEVVPAMPSHEEAKNLPLVGDQDEGETISEDTLKKKSKGELIEIATALEMEVDEKIKKDDLIKLIIEKANQKEPV